MRLQISFEPIVSGIRKQSQNNLCIQDAHFQARITDVQFPRIIDILELQMVFLLHQILNRGKQFFNGAFLISGPCLLHSLLSMCCSFPSVIYKAIGAGWGGGRSINRYIFCRHVNLISNHGERITPTTLLFGPRDIQTFLRS